MTPDLATLRALLAAATPGPWEARFEYDDSSGEQRMIHAPNGGNRLLDRVVVGTVYYDGINLAIREENAALIVAAVNALPALLDQIERQHLTALVLAKALLKATGEEYPNDVERIVERAEDLARRALAGGKP